MNIQQLSVFIENRAGTMLHILNILTAQGIQLLAVNIADTVEYGIFRIICSEPSKAYKALKDSNLSVTLSDVFAIELENKVGAMADTLEIFQKENISITYLYSFLLKGKGIMIFRTTDNEHTREVMNLYDMNFITESNLYELA